MSDKGWAIKTPTGEILLVTFCPNMKGYEEQCQTNSWISYTAVICHKSGFGWNRIKATREKAGFSCIKVTVKEGWDEKS